MPAIFQELPLYNVHCRTQAIQFRETQRKASFPGAIRLLTKVFVKRSHAVERIAKEAETEEQIARNLMRSGNDGLDANKKAKSGASELKADS